VPHVLIVDDELNIRRVLAAMLAREGYEVTTAADGEQALAVLHKTPVHVIVTDLVMPRLQGLSPLYDSGVDAALRHMGITTIVATGVSVNVALLATVIEGVNRAYQVVVPRDAVAGVGAEYVEAVLDNTIALLATLTTTKELVDIWQS
jgi:nicotinamidase-related amidase